ncbi:late embryogenesis abundant protein At1g64065-like isoform X14 [Rhodamnia argentea]|uniref:Late embryogenesis abundant protein At1g64065-like isoform X14 n=1 Tax=Rhodamnia argentea TaxID=178133 RepID=A0ABM3H859_9MYRT|nr:late embryogenesis abundant protein At1g64065-like isoform X14 [Rhodamnia argentea]
MAEKNQNQYQLPESNAYRRSDQESLHTMEDEEAKRKKRMKWTIGIIAFVIFQVVQALFFVLVIMKFKSPKFRVAEFDIQTLEFNQSSPSFNMSFVAPIRVKNTNWGPFKYGASTVDFTYGGFPVGQAIIPKSKANFKSTKKINVDVTLNSATLSNNSNLGSDLSSGVITLNSQGELRGKITVMFMFKKKKTSQMNCTMAISTSTKAVQSLSCN